jgi:hypothetical protein
VRFNFEDGTGTTVSNSSGVGSNGTLYGAAWQANGRSGGGIDFTGEGQRVVVPAGVLKDAKATTVMLWAKLSATPVGSTLFDFGTGAGEHFALQINDGSAAPRLKLIAKTAQLDQSVAAQITLPTNRWHHVAVTLGAGQAAIYVDGRPLARGAMTLTPADLGASAAGWIGEPRGIGVNTYGTVDDFRLFDRLVDPKEISEIALEGADYTYFTFDEACPNRVFAAAPADMSAELPNGATLVGGRLGNALEFNVQNSAAQHAILPSGIVHNCTDDLTFAAWVNLKTSNPWSRVFDIGTGTSTFMYLSPITGTGTIRFAAKLNAGEAAFNDEQYLARSTALDLGVWRHLAVVLDAGNSGHLYVDGVEVATSTAITINPSDMGNTLQNYLGKSQYPLDEYLSGRLDEIVISCRAFTFDEIQLLVKLAPAQ